MMKRMTYTALTTHAIPQVKPNKSNGTLKNFTLLVISSERTQTGLEKTMYAVALCVSSRQLRKSSAA